MIMQDLEGVRVPVRPIRTITHGGATISLAASNAKPATTTHGNAAHRY
jgi:hypothetical protein